MASEQSNAGILRGECLCRTVAYEVADAFEVPLGFLMDPLRHELQSREWQGKSRRYYAMPYGERYIWGVTAGIIRNLYETLYEP